MKLSVSLIIACLLWSCVPITSQIESVSESQILIDQEVEKVKKSNEAYRKLTAAGCSRENLWLVKPVLIDDQSYFESF